MFTAIVIVGCFAVLSLVVDGGLKLQALAKADGTAQEAARSGAQALDTGAALTGHGIQIQPQQAVTAAQAYLRSAGVTGTVTVTGNQIQVTVAAPYTPLFPLISSGTVTGHGSAQLLYQGG
ncbi:hypothetical protein DN069_34010 [Streptacidiphilus pinicola]|uniref:Uncharacterized protein n=1 Tax=Streptacidiphilus pinicola TaxID=2219663 RepID=A0A2X0K1M2_9ACTN|nr:hypothetical protein [Streptacidiphilus pinicola]RAG81240.1 hypothetical protein DN069_34010 [Streptacidiphilus pinicola]